MLNRDLISHLVEDGLLTAEHAKTLTQEARRNAMPLISYLVKKNVLKSDIVMKYCSTKFAIATFDLALLESAPPSAIFTSFFMRKHRMIGLGYKNNFYQLGVSDPTSLNKINLIAFYMEAPIDLLLIDDAKLEIFLAKLEKNYLLEWQDENNVTQPSVVINEDENDEPIIQLVDSLLNEARLRNCSDIHIEPQENNCLVRFRCDGMLYINSTLSTTIAMRVITRLKMMSNLDIAERRLPQDGRIKSWIDIRVNTCPTLYGEKLVLRLLDTTKIKPCLTTIGLNEQQLSMIEHFLNRPQGLMIVTGPTGSGKTVTLYSALLSINALQKNIMTIEDPIEISLPGINQMTINPTIGLSFATILRSTLRQDPDIIMVGEIRDYETAHLALSAAQTGHLVLTTLHANNAEETLLRLESMGLSKELIYSSSRLIIAQRLIRTLCKNCKKLDPLNRGFYIAEGCEQCHQGYKGRIGVFECKANGSYQHLWESGLAKVRSGMTSINELRRVINEN